MGHQGPGAKSEAGEPRVSFWDGFRSGMMGKGPRYVQKQRAARMREAELLRKSLESWQAELDDKAASAYAAGQRHVVNPRVVADELGGLPVVIQYYGNNDPTKIDVYYGGEGTPHGPGHGHITIRKGVIDTWWLPADPSGRRERIV